MIERVVFLLGAILDQRDYHRFGFDIIQERGYRVEAWDFMPWMKPNYVKNYNVPDPVEFLIKNKTFLIEDKTQFHILNQLWPIDIDDQEDLAVAGLFLS